MNRPYLFQVTQNDDLAHQLAQTRFGLRPYLAVQEPTAQRRAINSESFRESLSTERYQLPQSPALRESEPSDRKRTADPCARFGDRRRLDHREHDVVAIASGVTDRENGTVAAHHGIPLRKLSGNWLPCYSLANEKCLPDRQCRADCDHKITVGDNKCIIARCRLN